MENRLILRPFIQIMPSNITYYIHISIIKFVGYLPISYVIAKAMSSFYKRSKSTN